ncbi:MAG TPA: hypothetical protein DDY98_05460, partial [Ruminococcaceae bacterium]|nr:hypothetical protein [Oscillospiraceae bacterium]
RVKLFAGITVSVLSALILLTAEMVTAFALYGFDGYAATFQVFLPATMFSLTIGQASIILMLLLLAVSAFLSVLAMCLSQLTRNRSAASSLMIVVMFLSMITPPSSLRVISLLWGMMPGAFCGAWAFYDYHLIGIGGHYLNCLQYTPLCYLLLGGALAYLTGRAYAKSEIQNKG